MKRKSEERSVVLTAPSLSEDIPRTKGVTFNENTLNQVASQSDFKITKGKTNVYIYKGDPETIMRIQEHDWNLASCVCSTFRSRRLDKMTLNRRHS